MWSEGDCNSLDYYFWNKVKEKVIKIDLTNRLKTRENWRSEPKAYGKIFIAFNLLDILGVIKRFAWRFWTVKEKESQCIEMIYD